ncbi:DNA mismatch repair protein [Dictyocaulus viviparus]|uniref:DNA mismatch repair protein n=1 Tax=Dictyocaulus viviparus TaxID=29172 RepID=A0A0D8XMM5_DICVI|nr:DNA mismatch repair protein [Dictyocaulus viviparus]
MESMRASAGLDGTCISAEELFHNCPVRRKSFRNHSDETNKVADVIMRYAVHRPDVSFSMRRGGGADFRTSGRGTRSEIVTALLGKSCGENMTEFKHSSPRLHYTAEICLTKPLSSSTASGVQAKKNRQKAFFIFINSRLVQCPSLKYSVDSLFTVRDLVCPFVLVSLSIAPSRIDVNVHPTKETVMFLEEEAIIEDLQQTEMAPSSISDPRQTAPSSSQILRIPSQTQSVMDVDSFSNNVESELVQSSSPISTKKRVDYTLVRVDAKERRLDEFISSPGAAKSSSIEMVQVVGSQQEGAYETDVSGQRVFDFESLRRLRKGICDKVSQPLREFFKSLNFVGCVTVNSMLLQFGTGLYIVKLDNVLQELFYQALIFSFGNFGSYKLEGDAYILDLLRLGGIEEEYEMPALELLNSQSAMLNDYFSLEIMKPNDVDHDVDGLKMCHLTAIPSIIDGYVPQLEGLPTLLVELVKEVDWEEEETCFDGICRALAHFFMIKEEFCAGMGEIPTPWLAVIRDLLVPRIKSHLIPSESLKDHISRLVDLHDLYKIFERC